MTPITKRGKTMKFIKLRNGMRKSNSYTVNIDNIACIETIVSEDGKVKTWIQGKGFENGELYVKETEDEILQMIKDVEKLSCLS